MADTLDPAKPSADYEAMCHKWDMVAAILDGAEAMRAAGHNSSIPGPAVPVANLAQLPNNRHANEAPYLPRFPNETAVDYELRRRFAPFYNVYSDISSSLTSKPFSKPVELAEGTAKELEEISDNIDGQGNNQHVVASAVFKSGVDFGVHYILVEYPNVGAGKTLADERQIGARPYWCSIPAKRVPVLRRYFLNGKSIIHHARIYEPAIKPDGFDEIAVERVRVLNREPVYNELNLIVGFGPATWQLWELVEKDAAGKTEKNWIVIDQGVYSIGEIPLVVFQPDEQGQNVGRPKMPLLHIAHDQVELFQQDSNLKCASEMASGPMIAILGVPPNADGSTTTVPVGPKTAFVLGFGNGGEVPDVKYVEPAATSLTFLQNRYESHVKRMKDAGLMPLSDANLTVVTSANLMMRANSQVQAWTFRLKDSLEQAWVLTAKWLGRDDNTIQVEINTDFAADIDSGNKANAVLNAEKQGVVSKKETALTLQNLGVLRKAYDYDDDEEQLATEQQGLQPEQPIDPVTGLPIAQPDLIPPDITQKPGAQPGQTYGT